MRDLRGTDVVFLHLVSPTGELSQVETAVTLDELAVFFTKREVAAVETPPEPDVSPEPQPPAAAQEIVS